jgi:hypothetical protein
MRTQRDGSLAVAVKPVLRPTVPKAETTSNKASRKIPPDFECGTRASSKLTTRISPP